MSVELISHITTKKINKLTELVYLNNELNFTDVNSPRYKIWQERNDNDELSKYLFYNNISDKEIELTLLLGADINHRYAYMMTPLMRACEINDLKKVKQLISYNANVNLKNEIGNTALMHTHTEYGKEINDDTLDIVDILLDAGADVDIENAEGKTLLENIVYAPNGLPIENIKYGNLIIDKLVNHLLKDTELFKIETIPNRDKKVLVYINYPNCYPIIVYPDTTREVIFSVINYIIYNKKELNNVIDCRDFSPTKPNNYYHIESEQSTAKNDVFFEMFINNSFISIMEHCQNYCTIVISHPRDGAHHPCEILSRKKYYEAIKLVEMV